MYISVIRYVCNWKGEEWEKGGFSPQGWITNFAKYFQVATYLSCHIM